MFGKLREYSQGWTVWKVQPKLFKFIVCNPYKSSPSLTILVPLWFIIISFHFDSQNNSKYLDCTPLIVVSVIILNQKRRRRRLLGFPVYFCGFISSTDLYQMKRCSTGYAALSQDFIHWMRLEKIETNSLTSSQMFGITLNNIVQLILCWADTEFAV